MEEENKDITSDNDLEKPISEDSITKNFKVQSSEPENRISMLYLFLATFVVAVIFISFLLKSVSPSMDIDIGENPVPAMDQREDEEGGLNAIDQRLKMIQNDEKMPGVSELRGFEEPEDTVKRLRAENKEAIEENNKDSEEVDLKIEPVKVQINDVEKVSTITKIYVGQYSDMQKAVEMQTNIINSGLQLSPMITEVNGYYTVQVGAFANYDAAKTYATQLQNAGFAAKIVKEFK